MKTRIKHVQKDNRFLWPLVLHLAAAAIGGILIAAISAWAVWVTLGAPLLSSPGAAVLSTSDRLDIIKIILAMVAGLGGIVALVVAYRRQRVTEATNEREERVARENREHAIVLASSAEHDATERRVTDLFTKSADQLGSEKAPVRLAGLYSLERLAQDNSNHRQTIVNVLCAYLRMPFESRPLGADLSKVQNREELEVRRGAQDILSRHLTEIDLADDQAESESPIFWPGIDIDLSGASLFGFELRFAKPRETMFLGTKFYGGTEFHGTTFTHRSFFSDAEFHGLAFIVACEFESVAWFDDVQFLGETAFEGSHFRAYTTLKGAHFHQRVTFGDAEFLDKVILKDIRCDAECDIRLSS
jgi:hypothetical protein